MKKPSPGEIWRFTKNLTLGQQKVGPQSLFLVIDAVFVDTYLQGDIYDIVCLIEGERHSFYAGSNHIEHYTDESSL